MDSDITSLGFSDTGFSPWASRTCAVTKSQTNMYKVKGHQIANMFSFWTLQPFTLVSALQDLCFLWWNESCGFRKSLWSYIFGIGPPALWGPHFTLSHQPQGQMWEGCQVSTGTHRSLLWNKGEAGRCRGVKQDKNRDLVTWLSAIML